MTSYGKFKGRLLPNVVFCVSQDNEGKTSRYVSLGKSLLSKTPVRKAYVANSRKVTLCGEPLKGHPLWQTLER